MPNTIVNGPAVNEQIIGNLYKRVAEAKRRIAEIDQEISRLQPLRDQYRRHAEQAQRRSKCGRQHKKWQQKLARQRAYESKIFELRMERAMLSESLMKLHKEIRWYRPSTVQQEEPLPPHPAVHDSERIVTV